MYSSRVKRAEWCGQGLKMAKSQNKKAVLLLGGAGYIGSHLAYLLMQCGYVPIILDNLSTGSRHAVETFDFFQGNYGDSKLLEKIYQQYLFSSVIHLASYTQVGESTANPLKYYQNNISETLNLLQFMRRYNIQNLLFSSSASVYGEPRNESLIDENHPKLPLSPYGRTKWMIEQILTDMHAAYGMNVICLRYFNVAGVSCNFFSSTMHFAETNLIPLLIKTILHGEVITVFGMDYPTRDGTCIRDYIHVMDVCNAHILALEQLLENQDSKILLYNLGTGIGHTVLEVIQRTEKITGKKIQFIKGNRRPGDPAMLVADGRIAMQALNWNPIHSGLDQIIADAWEFGNSSGC